MAVNGNKITLSTTIASTVAALTGYRIGLTAAGHNVTAVKLKDD
jgi:hypothetical protein